MSFLSCFKFIVELIIGYSKGRLAQLDRVLASEARCREFESHIAHHFLSDKNSFSFLYFNFLKAIRHINKKKEISDR